MIKIFKLSKRYSKSYIFKNFSYKFAEKGLYLVIGKSGKGKTTLLNILGGKDDKYEGSLYVKESPLYFSSDSKLVSDLKVKDILKLFIDIEKVTFIEYLSITHLLDKKVSKISLGEKQLVILNLALNTSKTIILLDEPFSALSKDNEIKATSLLEVLSKDKLVIISSHKNSFKEGTIINLDKLKSLKVKPFSNLQKKEEKKIAFKYYLFYLKKQLIKKIIFLLSILFIVYGFIYLNNYLKDFNIYSNEGQYVRRKSKILEINDHLFYEVVKKLASFIKNYNANYYHQELYEIDLTSDGLYIDNGFLLTSIEYIEKDLKENEIVLGLNYRLFCKNNNIKVCNEEHLQTLLVNKSINNFNYIIKEIFASEDNVILSNNRFNKVREDYEYVEYYFDVSKEKVNELFSLINEDDLLVEFEYTKIGEADDYVRYLVEKKEGCNYDENIDYSKYIVCLDKGYNCNYIKPFYSLIKIDEEDISDLSLKVVNDKLTLDEIIISSKLSLLLNKGKGEIIELFFEYIDSVEKVSLLIKDVIDSDEYLFYQNSKWSYDFFKYKLNFLNEDLVIKNILIYEEIKEDDYVDYNEYKEIINYLVNKIKKMKKYLFIFNVSVSIVGISVLILLELFYNKFKKEYFGYLKIVN